MPEDTVKTADELHEEVYGKPTDAPVQPYVDDFESGDEPGDTNAPPPGTPPPAGSDDFKHKYEVLRGKYNTEMGRMNTMLSTALTEKEQLLARMTASPTPASPFTDDVNIAAGDSDIDFLKAQYPDAYPGIEALVAKRTAEIVKPVAENLANTAATAAKLEGDKYFEALDGRVKDWKAINDDPEFIAWLGAKDRYTGATKHQLLRDAFYKRDPERSISFFEDYLKEKGSAPPPPPPPAQQFVDTDAYPNNSGNPAPSTVEKGIVYRSDIDRFYKDRATGRFSGTAEDAAKIESRFFRAIKEGKVR
jgi:hypothetical protein